MDIITKTIEIEELDLSVRSYNILKRAGVNTIGDLCELKLGELAYLKHMSQMSFIEIMGATYGIKLAIEQARIDILEYLREQAEGE